MLGVAKQLYEDDLSSDELETLRNLVREALGEDAEEQEELVLELSAADLFEMIDELGLEKKITCEASTSPARPNSSAKNIERREDVGRATREFPHTAMVCLDLDDDGKDFQSISLATRAFLESEVAKLCKCVQQATDMSCSNAEERACLDEADAILEEERQKTIAASVSGENTAEVDMTDEQLDALRFYEELALRHELHHKALLHSLTKLETAELFEQHALSAPKEHDFDIVKKLLSESRQAGNARLREQLKQKTGKGKVTMRYVNNELVQTKDKYIVPAKDTELIRATTCQLTLLGNSSKARREQRLLADGKTTSKTRK